ncbi:MAG: V-type ATP synthase subunit E family protein [Promethearchaeota archaeon]
METDKKETKLGFLRQQILEEAQLKAGDILAEAKAKVEAIKKNERDEIEYLNNEKLKNIKKEMERKYLDVKNSIEREKIKKVLEYKQEQLDALISEIVKRFKEKLSRDPEYYYNNYLSRQISDVLSQTSFKEYYLILNPKDNNYIKEHPKFLEKFNANIQLSDDLLPDNEIGCVMRDKSGNIGFDSTLSKKIEFHLNFIKMKLSEILFKEE